MLFHGGFYYFLEVVRNRHLYIRRSRTIAGIGREPRFRIWSAPLRGGNSFGLRAPELHLLDGRWFIYYSADDKRPENRRIWVLESESANPVGRYHCAGPLATGGWATDGTVLTLEHGRRFFVWSGRASHHRERQNLYIAPMAAPERLAAPRVRIASPDQPWEKDVLPVCEAPQVLQRNGGIFIVYSASASWSEHCCLGLLHNASADVLDPAAWTKRGPVFRKTEQVWNLSPFSFVSSLGRTDDWMLYHPRLDASVTESFPAFEARPFSWSSDGFPDFEATFPHHPTLGEGAALAATSPLSRDLIRL